MGINVPTGKDSLSLSQQYPNGEKIISPGTVIVTSGGEVSDIRKVVSPVMVNDKNSSFYHIDFSFCAQRLGGSAFAQTLGRVGIDVPTVEMGITAARIIAARIRGDKTLPKRVLLPSRLIERDSV